MGSAAGRWCSPQSLFRRTAPVRTKRSSRSPWRWSLIVGLVLATAYSFVLGGRVDASRSGIEG